MRDEINAALKDALEAGDKRRAATLRLILTAIKDRDLAARQTGRDGVSDEEILDVLNTMVRQRSSSVLEFEEAGQVELADQEREEGCIIREFLPEQFDDEDVEKACESVVEDLGATGLRDIGRCMSELKQRYPGQMDFVKASCKVRSLLRAENAAIDPTVSDATTSDDLGSAGDAAAVNDAAAVIKGHEGS